MPENPLATKEQREELRRGKPLSMRKRVEADIAALDGLDIAQEMAEAHERLLQEAWIDADVHPRHGYGTCGRCDKFWDDSIEALRRWQAWEGEQR